MPVAGRTLDELPHDPHRGPEPEIGARHRRESAYEVDHSPSRLRVRVAERHELVAQDGLEAARARGHERKPQA